jgi:hypothetical protein
MEELDNEFHSWTYKNFEEKNSNLYYKKNTAEGPKQCSFVHRWMADPAIRTYHHFTFDPSQKCGPKVYNKFKGFNGDHLEGDPVLGQEGLEVWLRLRSMIVNHDPLAINFLDKYLAWTIQRPDQKTKVALVFRSFEGAGKGTFWEYWGFVMIGKDYTVETPSVSDIMTDGFNSVGENALLALFDESESKDIPLDRAKNFITQDVQMLRQKYKDTKANVSNYTNCVFLSNNEAPVIIKDKERRHVVFRCDETYADESTAKTPEEKKEFWDYMYQFLNPRCPCPHTAAAIMAYYRQIDINKFSPQFERVLTDEYQRVKAQSMPAELKFLRDYTDDIVSHQHFKTEAQRLSFVVYLSAKELYNLYLEWNKNYNPRGVAVGKTRMVDRWSQYPFIKRTSVARHGNAQWLRWCVEDFEAYWKRSGYATAFQSDSIDAVEHKRLLEMNRPVLGN